MNPITQWLDPVEVRHLAEQLLRPVDSAPMLIADPVLDSSFVGFMSDGESSDDSETPEQNETHITEEPALHSETVPTQNDTLGDISAEASQSASAALVPSRLLERIQIFRDWLAKNFSSTEIFILDGDGQVVFDESGHGRFHFMARNFALSPQLTGSIHIKIGPAAILEIIPAETPSGRMVLGATFPDTLPIDHIQTITEILIQTGSPA